MAEQLTPDEILQQFENIDANAAGVLRATLQQLNAQVAQQQGQLQQIQQQQHQQQQQPVQGQGQAQGAQPQAQLLPASVKVEKPSVFKGQMDGNAVETFIYQCNMYFGLVNVVGDNAQARLAALWLADDAATWFRSQSPDLTTVSWIQLQDALRKQFRPVDHVRRARDAWASCVQTGGITGYINMFRRLLVQVSDASPAEALDKFIRGLKPFLRQQVLVQNPQDWEAAALVAERVGTATFTSRGGSQGQTGGFSSSRPSAGAGSSGVAPMDLGAMQGSSGQGSGQGSGQSGSSRRNQSRDRTCFLCKKPGHFCKDCPLRHRGGPKNGPQGH